MIANSSAGLLSDFHHNEFFPLFHKTKSKTENSVNLPNKHSVCRTRQCFRVGEDIYLHLQF